MIAPLLWLLLATAGVTEPRVVPWQGSSPVVVTRPAQPTAGQRIVVAIGNLPPRARKVVVVAGTQSAPARRVSTGLRQATLTAGEAGPQTVVVWFTVNGVRYETPGAVIFVAPAE